MSRTGAQLDEGIELRPLYVWGANVGSGDRFPDKQEAHTDPTHVLVLRVWVSLSPEGDQNKAPGRWPRARGAQAQWAAHGAWATRPRSHRDGALLGRPPGYRESCACL